MGELRGDYHRMGGGREAQAVGRDLMRRVTSSSIPFFLFIYDFWPWIGWETKGWLGGKQRSLDRENSSGYHRNRSRRRRSAGILATLEGGGELN